MKHCDILIIGAGAAGITAAISAWEAGCRDVILIDRKKEPGGILLQCAHRGFGAGLTGPEYTKKLTWHFPEGIPLYLNTTVLSVSPDKIAVISNPKTGLSKFCFQQLILATGCREVPAGALPIAGTRPSGVYTAGQAQKLINLHGFVPEDPVIILGSGDLGLIMANQLALEGRKIAAIVEQKPVCGGMARNQQCLTKHCIPLLCSSTITEIFGAEHLEGVKIRNLHTEEESFLHCKTLLIATGLRPDRELTHDLAHPDWLHLCGNCNTVHPMVEAVVQEGKQAGTNAWHKIRGGL